MYNTLNNPSAHPSYSHYYLLSPSTLFFFFFAHLIVFLHILLFFAHLFVLHFFISLHILLLFLFFSIYMPLCCVTLYNFYSYYFALSTERTWFDYISLLIIPCIIYYVTNKETLNLDGVCCCEGGNTQTPSLDIIDIGLYYAITGHNIAGLY